MDRRLKKQLIYGTIFLAVLLLIVAGPILFRGKPAASCFDKIQNKNEVGVDCGGACGTPCAQGEEPVKLLSRVGVFFSSFNRSTLLAQIENPRDDFALKRFSYTFTLYGDEDTPLASVRGESFMYAREVKYLLVPNLSYPADLITKVEFYSDDPVWIPADTFPAPSVVIQNYAARARGNEAIIVDGDIVHTGRATLRRVDIIAIFYGRFDQVSGASQTVIDNLAPRERRTFTILHPMNENFNLAKTQVFAFGER